MAGFIHPFTGLDHLLWVLVSCYGQQLNSGKLLYTKHYFDCRLFNRCWRFASIAEYGIIASLIVTAIAQNQIGFCLLLLHYSQAFIAWCWTRTCGTYCCISSWSGMALIYCCGLALGALFTYLMAKKLWVLAQQLLQLLLIKPLQKKVALSYLFGFEMCVHKNIYPVFTALIIFDMFRPMIFFNQKVILLY